WKDSVGGRIVHRVVANAGKVVLACLIVCGFTAQPSLEMSLNAGSAQSSTPSPAEIVASRFPSEDIPVIPATFSTASVMSIEHWETFNQGALSSTVTADPAWPTAVETTDPSSSEPAQQPVDTVKPDPPKVQAANAAPRRPKARSSNVLN